MSSRYTTWTLGLAVACAIGATGCSFIYDAGTFDDVPDAVPPPDAMEPPPDVNINALALTNTTPTDIFEGIGCVPEADACAAASRPVPIVVHGMNIAANATVVLDGAGFDGELVDATVSSDGMLLAFVVSIPVMPALDDGDTDTITITVSQGEVDDTAALTVRGLDELTASVDVGGGMLDASTLHSLYSTIDIDAQVTLIGAAPARFAATASIVVDAALSADGGDASGDTGGAGVAGGCTGGDEESAGDCLGGGGRAGGQSAGGGGGGHATMGSQGATASGGAGGDDSGSPELVPLSAEGGNGGGGGGLGTLSAAGGGGGGGGGIIELSSAGIVTIGTNASVTADGGTGDGGGGSCNILTEHGGGGGGGAGGAVLVRAQTQLVDDAGTARLSAAAGAKGDDGCNAGGNGAAGRVRVDVPTAGSTPAFATGASYRGPILAPGTAPIATESPISVELYGDAGTTYYIEREGADRAEVTTDSNRRVSHDVELAAGINRICAVVRTDVSISSPEGTNCITVAYIP